MNYKPIQKGGESAKRKIDKLEKTRESKNSGEYSKSLHFTYHGPRISHIGTM